MRLSELPEQIGIRQMGEKGRAAGARPPRGQRDDRYPPPPAQPRTRAPTSPSRAARSDVRARSDAELIRLQRGAAILVVEQVLTCVSTQQS